MKRGLITFFVFILVIIAIIVLGYFGDAKVDESETTKCVFGAGEKMCWVWAENVHSENAEYVVSDASG